MFSRDLETHLVGCWKGNGDGDYQGKSEVEVGLKEVRVLLLRETGNILGGCRRCVTGSIEFLGVGMRGGGRE